MSRQPLYRKEVFLYCLGVVGIVNRYEGEAAFHQVGNSSGTGLKQLYDLEKPILLLHIQGGLPASLLLQTLLDQGEELLFGLEVDILTVNPLQLLMVEDGVGLADRLQGEKLDELSSEQ